MVSYIALYLCGINLWSGLRFAQDKQRAIRGERRIPEGDLLGLALIGGWPACLLASKVFRHKTRKQPFRTQLLLISGFEASIGTGLMIAPFLPA